MPRQQISEKEQERRDELRKQQRPRAYKLSEFCDEFRIPRTRAYEEMNAGRLKAKKAGRTVIITDEQAEEWLESLPARPVPEKPEDAAAA